MLLLWVLPFPFPGPTALFQLWAHLPPCWLPAPHLSSHDLRNSACFSFGWPHLLPFLLSFQSNNWPFPLERFYCPH